MKKLQPVKFEKLVAESLKITSLPGLSTDAEFLKMLNRNLNLKSRPEQGFYQIWFSGIFNGLAAAAIGIIILVGLNVLPPFFINASITGSGLIQEKILRVTVDQRILWQQLASDLKKFR